MVSINLKVFSGRTVPFVKVQAIL